MPREGSLTLSDIREPTLAIACQRCGRYWRYNVASLVAAQGADAKLTDLLVTLANCEKARSVGVHDRCKAVYERFSLPSATARTESDEAIRSAGRRPEDGQRARKGRTAGRA